MYTSKQITLTAISPEDVGFDSDLSANIRGSDSRKSILLEGGINCDGTYRIWGFAASEWYLLKTIGPLAIPYTRYAIIDCEFLNAFDKVYIHSVGIVVPTYWRIAMGSNSGGF